MSPFIRVTSKWPLHLSHCTIFEEIYDPWWCIVWCFVWICAKKTNNKNFKRPSWQKFQNALLYWRWSDVLWWWYRAHNPAYVLADLESRSRSMTFALVPVSSKMHQLYHIDSNVLYGWWQFWVWTSWRRDDKTVLD